MKKVTVSILILTFILSISTTAFATVPSTNAKGTERINTVQQQLGEKKQKIEQRKSDIEAFKAAVKEKRDAVKEKREANIILKNENIELRKTIAEKLQTIKELGTVLSPEIREQLKTYRTGISEIKSELKDTKGSIKAEKTENKIVIRDMDCVKLEEVYTEISRIQLYRHERLVEINEILMSIMPIIQ